MSFVQETIYNHNSILLSNKEKLSKLHFPKIYDFEIYQFQNINNDSLYIVYHELNGFSLFNSIDDIINNKLYDSNAYKLPNMKKIDITYKYIDDVDNINIFKFNDIKIGHINTTYEQILNPLKNRYEPTKYPFTTEYLFVKNNHTAVFLYIKNSGYKISNYYWGKKDFEQIIDDYNITLYSNKN